MPEITSQMVFVLVMVPTLGYAFVAQGRRRVLLRALREREPKLWERLGSPTSWSRTDAASPLLRFVYDESDAGELHPEVRAARDELLKVLRLRGAFIAYVVVVVLVYVAQGFFD